MNDLYKNDEYCMDFSNEEIVKYFINKVTTHPNVCVKTFRSNEDEQSFDSSNNYKYFCFDGEKEDFCIGFWGHQTAIFILNEEFMFIDDCSKEQRSSSDTYGNVVYEGTLRDKTHEEILAIIYELFTILLGTQEIVINEIIESQTGFQYPKCRYNVSINKSENTKKFIQFENIFFTIN